MMFEFEPCSIQTLPRYEAANGYATLKTWAVDQQFDRMEQEWSSCAEVPPSFEKDQTFMPPSYSPLVENGLPFGAILHFHVSSRECKPSIPGSLSLETWSPGIGDES